MTFYGGVGSYGGKMLKVFYAKEYDPNCYV